MRVSKIFVLASSGYPFLIFIFYPLRVLSADTRVRIFFTSLVGIIHLDNLSYRIIVLYYDILIREKKKEI